MEIIYTMEQNKNEVSFEAAIARLEEIVRSLDAGEAALDESLALFEEGVKLVKYCSNKLDAAEQTVKILTKGDDGMTEQDFAPMKEN